MRLRLLTAAAVAAALGLPGTAWAVTSPAIPRGQGELTVTGLTFLGQDVVPTGEQFQGTTVGGLSGITYDPTSDSYLAISDDRSQTNPARFYRVTIDVADGNLETNDVTFTGVTTLLQPDGTPYPALSLDPEGIALEATGTVLVSSEGENTDARRTLPFVNRYAIGGAFVATAVPIPGAYTPTATSGVRNNLALESLTLSPDEGDLITATENALSQDGPAASTTSSSSSRILATEDGVRAQYVYEVAPVAAPPVPPGSFATNGLVELLALDDEGTVLALERSFSTGVGNDVRLFESDLDDGTRVTDDLTSFSGRGFRPVSKRQIFDFGSLRIPIDNLEGMTFGPATAAGKPTLIVVSDNNFSAGQFTQFLAFALDIAPAPAAVVPEVGVPVLLPALAAILVTGVLARRPRRPARP